MERQGRLDELPGNVYFETGLEGVEKECMNILRSVAPGNRFALGIMEDIGDIASPEYCDILATIAKTVVEYGTYPIQHM